MQIFTRTALVKNILKNMGKKIITLFIGVFVFAHIFPVISIIADTTNTAYAEGASTEGTSTEGTSTEDEPASETTQEQNADAKNNNKPNSLLETYNSTENNSFKKKFSEFATLIVALFTPMIAIAVKFAGILMGDAFIMGTAGTDAQFPIADLLYELWDVVRTLVNYGFLLILLFVAVANILPINKDQNNLSTILPSLIIAIITVNMTWFMMRIVFDVAEVATHIVYSLPESIANKSVGTSKSLLNDEKCVVNTKTPEEWRAMSDEAKLSNPAAEEATTKKMPYIHGNCYPELIYVKPTAAYTDISSTQMKDAAEHLDINTTDEEDEDFERLSEKGTNIAKVNYGALTIYWSDFDYSRFSEGTILPLMAFSIMQIQNLPRMASQGISEATAKDADGNAVLPDNWTSLFINTIFAFVLMIIMLILFITMVINLFGRVIVLWVNIILSPVLSLNMVLKDIGMSPVQGDGEWLGYLSFMRSAFAPAIMGIPFVIGFILITVGQQYSMPGFNESGNINLQGSLVNGVASIHALFYHLLTIGVLWAGGVKALEMSKNPVSTNFAQGITTGVADMATWIRNASMKIPMIPGGINSNGKVELLSMDNIRNDMVQKFKSDINRLDNDMADKIRGTSRFILQDKFESLGLEKDSGDGKNAIEILKKIEANDATYQKISSSGETESQQVQEFMKTNNVPRILREKTNTVRELLSMMYEAQNTGKSAMSVAGKQQINIMMKTYNRQNSNKPLAAPITNTINNTNIINNNKHQDAEEKTDADTEDVNLQPDVDNDAIRDKKPSREPTPTKTPPKNINS